MKKVNFFYKNKKYQIDYEFLKNTSLTIATKKDAREKIVKINLINEFDSVNEIPEETIFSFFDYFETQNVELTNQNIFSFKFLSDKFQIPQMMKEVDEYIQNNYRKIINEILESNKLQNSLTMLNLYQVDLISNHILEFLTDDRLISLPLNILYRILSKYLNNSNDQNRCKIKKKDDKSNFEKVIISDDEESYKIINNSSGENDENNDDKNDSTDEDDEIYSNKDDSINEDDELFNNNNNSISENDENNETKIINHQFEILKNYSFNLNLLNKYETNNDFIEGNNYRIGLEIGNLKHYIHLNLINMENNKFDPDNVTNSDYNNKFLEKFPTYSFNYKDKNWIRIKNNCDIIDFKPVNLPYIYLTPFRMISNIYDFNILNYKSNFIEASNSENIIYIQSTISSNIDDLFYEKNSSAQFFVKSKSKYFILDEKNTYFSILGYDKNNKNLWFPAFDTYPDTSKFEILNIDEFNIRKANENINSILHSLNINNIDDIQECFYLDKQLPIKETNFAVFIALLMTKSFIIYLDDFMKYFPNEIQFHFNVILNVIRQFKNQDEQNLRNILFLEKGMLDLFLPIISHNLIIMFAQIFSKRYKEIESSNFCLQFPLKICEIETQQKKIFDELFFYDSKNSQLDISKDDFKFEINNESDLSKIINVQLPESKGEECFIICEDEPPKGLLICDCLELFALK